jgi:hypothetical protein
MQGYMLVAMPRYVTPQFDRGLTCFCISARTGKMHTGLLNGSWGTLPLRLLRLQPLMSPRGALPCHEVTQTSLTVPDPLAPGSTCLSARCVSLRILHNRDLQRHKHVQTCLWQHIHCNCVGIHGHLRVSWATRHDTQQRSL